MEFSVWEDANRRNFPSACEWHDRLMQRLDAPNPDWVGAYRGTRGQETIEVRVDDQWGVAANKVVDAVARFENILQHASFRERRRCKTLK